MLRTSGLQSWATPEWLWLWMIQYWDFDLDAAASATNAKCKKYYDEQTNGLAHPWYTWTFCNPPFSQMKLWTAKAHEEQLRRNFSVVVAPSNGLTARWFAEIQSHVATYILAPRVAYVGPEGKNAPNGGTMLLEFGCDPLVQGKFFFRDLSDWKRRYELRPA